MKIKILTDGSYGNWIKESDLPVIVEATNVPDGFGFDVRGSELNRVKTNKIWKGFNDNHNYHFFSSEIEEV